MRKQDSEQGRSTEGGTHTIMQSIMNTFHKAMKIRKYLRLSKNSRMLSPAKPESMVQEAVTLPTTFQTVAAPDQSLRSTNLQSF